MACIEPKQGEFQHRQGYEHLEDARLSETGRKRNRQDRAKRYSVVGEWLVWRTFESSPAVHMHVGTFQIMPNSTTG